MNKPVNKIAFGLAALATASLPEDGQETVWLKIMPAGAFTGRDGRGPFTTGDRASMQAIVDRTLAYVAGTEVMVDYDHQSAFGVQPGVGGTAKAAGWFKAFEVRDDGIYGQVQWTAAAAQAIRNLEYRYLSPLFSTFKDGRVGRIDNVALVNQPALDLEAVAAAASRFTQKKDNEVTLLEKLAQALGLDPVAASEETVVTTVTAFVADRKSIASAAGLDEGASTDDVLTAMKAAPAGDVDTSKFVPMSMFTEVRDELTALKTSGATKAATDAVDQAIADGKLPPANRDWAMKAATRDLADFQAFVAAQPVLTARQLTPAAIVEGEPVLTESDLVAMKATGVSREAFIAARKLEAQ